MKFKNKREFAEAIIKYGKLEDDYCIVYFDGSKNTLSPFMYKSKDDNIEEPIYAYWDNYKTEWSVVGELEDMQPVWAWNNGSYAARELRFYDAINKATFYACGNRNGIRFDNIIPVKEEYIEDWMLEMQTKLGGYGKSN